MKIFKELMKRLNFLKLLKSIFKLDKPEEPTEPTMTSDELLTHIKETATPSDYKPDITRYVFGFEGGWGLTFCTFATLDHWGWINNSGGVSGHGFVIHPDGHHVSFNINSDIRHKADTVPNHRLINADYCRLGEPILPPVDSYEGPWKTWRTDNNKTLYIDKNGVDTSCVRIVNALRHLAGITTEMTSVTAEVLSEIN